MYTVCIVYDMSGTQESWLWNDLNVVQIQAFSGKLV